MHDGTFLPGLSHVRLGRLTGFSAAGTAEVELPGGEVFAARSLVPLTDGQIGHELAFTLADGEVLILGVLQPTLPTAEPEAQALIESDSQVALRCGKASITLTPDGRIAIRGTQILSRAEGPNQVQGGSVLLN